jgi:alanine dehydrogenase
MRVLSRDDMRQALSMSRAVVAVKRGFAQLSAGQADIPLRSALDVPRHDGVTLFMPGYLASDEQMAVKIVSVFDRNPDKGLPLIHAVVVVIDATTGQPVAVMDGAYLTALRTGAASGAATEALAREDACVAAIIGAGVQGRTQLEAVCAVRAIEKAWVYDLALEQARVYADEMEQRLSLPVTVAGTPDEAVGDADVICTATTATSPVFDDADIRPGTHINAIGAYTPEMQELPPDTVLRAKVVIDDYEASMAEAGDLLIPIKQGLMTAEHIYAELGDIITGQKVGRTSPEELTVFKSVGVAVQDVAVSAAVLEAARRMDLGTEVDLGAGRG